MNKKTRKKQQRIIRSRRGIIMIALIAVLVLIINIITASYSWFTPGEEEKRGMSYGFTGNARSENCSRTTYLGTKTASWSTEGDPYINQIVYGDTTAANSQTIGAGAVKYFKTEIINADTKNASCVSLYISSIPACTLAITYPGNTVRTFKSTDTRTDIYLVRDAYVKRHDSADVDGPGKLQIEWFVKNNSSSSITVNLGNLYLLYN